MKCCSRSTFGIIIGCSNIFIYMGVCIGMTLLYRDSPNKTGKFRLLVGLVVVVCLAMFATSGLLIFGIVKRLHKFIYPWLVTSGAVFVCNCGRTVFAVLLAIKESNPFAIWSFALLIDVLALVVQGLIVWPICTLYRDVEIANNQHRAAYNIVTSTVSTAL